MTSPATKCRACAVERLDDSNDKPYLAALADCLTWSLEDAVKGLCALHRNKLALMRAVGDQIKRSGRA